MFFKRQNSLTVAKSSWQWIPDDGTFDCASSLREFSSCSRQDEMWRIRRMHCTWSDLDGIRTSSLVILSLGSRHIG